VFPVLDFQTCIYNMPYDEVTDTGIIWGQEINANPIFFLPKNKFFFTTELKFLIVLVNCDPPPSVFSQVEPTMTDIFPLTQKCFLIHLLQFNMKTL
jgi:hypothetical protein